MAKIKEMPALEIIAGFKNTIDFYYHDGVAVCRTWPRSQGKSQTPNSVAQQPMFTYVQKLWPSVTEIVQKSYIDLAPDSALHMRDWFMRAYYGQIYRYPTEYSPP